MGLFWRKKFKVTKSQVDEYSRAIVAKKELASGKLDDYVIITDPYIMELIKPKLLPHQLYFSPGTPKGNIVLPKILIRFFLDDTAMEHLRSYECIKNYGMLYGKERRLVVVEDNRCH